MDVFDLDIQFRAVESGLADPDDVGDVKVVQDAFHHALRLVPLLFGADVFLAVVRIPLREAVGHVFVQPQRFEHEDGQLQAVFELVFQLLRQAHQVAFRDGELPHADEAVHLAARLVAEQGGGLVVPQRQVAVRPGAIEVRLILERAGHRTQGKHLVVLLGVAQHEHAVAVVIPVAGDLIQIAFGHKRRLGQLPAAALFLVLDEPLQDLNDARALRQQDRQPLPNDVRRGEQFQFPAEFVVVAFLGLFHLLEIGVEISAFRERGAVDALQHLVFLAAAPVRAGAGGEFVRLDAAGPHQVRPGAKIREIALPVERDRLAARGVLLHQFKFVRLIGHERACFFDRQFKPLDRQVFLDDRLHLGLDFFKVFRRERGLLVEVIVEAVVDGGADGELDPREQPHDRLRQNVGRGVAIRLLAVGVVKREDLQRRVRSQRGAKIHHLPVQPRGASRPEQTHRDLLAQRFDGGVFRHRAHVAAFECNVQHEYHSFFDLDGNKKAVSLERDAAMSRGSTLVRRPKAALTRPITGSAVAPYGVRVQVRAPGWWQPLPALCRLQPVAALSEKSGGGGDASPSALFCYAVMIAPADGIVKPLDNAL